MINDCLSWTKYLKRIWRNDLSKLLNWTGVPVDKLPTKSDC